MEKVTEHEVINQSTDIFYDLNLETKPDFIESMKRVYAWYNGELLDRVPVRFSGHNEEYNTIDNKGKWNTLEDYWFDTEYQVERYMNSIEDREFLGESFPVFWPNLGPNSFAAMFGGKIDFGDVTSWVHPFIDIDNIPTELTLNKENIYFKKLEELTKYALERCEGKFMVGYSDIHPGLDCIDAMLGTEEACMAMYDSDEELLALTHATLKPFLDLAEHFHKLLKTHKQLSVTWLNIPSYTSMHIPSCDLGSMISNKDFEKFAMPNIIQEVKHFEHNIFHVDGKDVANHLDIILEIDEINGYQWVQGVGVDKPIMQWTNLIKKIQGKGKGVIVDLEPSELDEFMSEFKPNGIYLCINETNPEVQSAILDKLKTWK